MVSSLVRGGDTADEFVEAYPRLNLAQVYDALSYYYDHQHEIDGLIEEGRPERVAASLGLVVDAVADGAAVARRKR